MGEVFIDGKDDKAELSYEFSSAALDKIFPKVEMNIDGLPFDEQPLEAMTLTEATQLAAEQHREALDSGAEAAGIVEINMFEKGETNPFFIIRIDSDRTHIDTGASLGTITGEGQKVDFVAGDEPVEFEEPSFENLSQAPSRPPGQLG